MSQPFIGEIRMFGGNFAPNGWALCQGQLIAIVENTTLFQLIGTTYGGDGQTTFALPNLQSRIPLHQGQGPGLTNRVISATGGQEQVGLELAQMPTHAHPIHTDAPATSGSPSNNLPGNTSGPNALYSTSPPQANIFNPAGNVNVGGGQPHDNMMPYLTINFIISLFGIFPSQA
jgi:microcystin-dependent protein